MRLWCYTIIQYLAAVSNLYRHLATLQRTHKRLTDDLKIDCGTHDYGDVLGVPQNKMKNKYCSTHSAEHSAGTVMRIDKKILV